MSLLTESGSRVTFGLFEADLQSGELWKADKRVKIQSQPFKVLATLLEHPGEVVTHEELQLRLWGKDTIVDFDHSLGTAINKIREALGDSAENPLFVETLARRGYRFIAPVGYSVVPSTTQIPQVTAAIPSHQPSKAPESPLVLQTEPPRKKVYAVYFAAATAALAATFALGIYLGSSHAHPLPAAHIPDHPFPSTPQL